MSITRNSFRRTTAFVAVFALALGVVIPAFSAVQSVSADQVTERSIQMSDSSPSGGTITTGVGSGTAVTYKLTFTTLTTMQSVNVDFCAETPLIGDATCTAPTGLALGTGAPTVTFNGSASAGWSAATTTSRLRFTNGTPQAAGTYVFEITGNTNPSNAIGNPAGTAMSFYARITTYANATYGTYANPGDPGAYADYGGIALSTTLPILVTARVMETFTLCASGDDGAGANPLELAGSCGDATAPNVTLGTAPNYVLNTSTASTGNIYSQISTNAFNGYSLWLRAANAAACLEKDVAQCGIPAIGAGGSAPSAFVAANAAFGAHVSDGVGAAVNGTITSSGTNTAVERWSGGAGNDPTLYLMDTTTPNDNVTTVYGSKIAESTEQASSVNNTITFAAIASPTTPAGIYTENFSLIGVGSF